MVAADSCIPAAHMRARVIRSCVRQPHARARVPPSDRRAQQPRARLHILLAFRVAPARLGPLQRRGAPAEHDGDGGVSTWPGSSSLKALQAPHPRRTYGAADSKGLPSEKGLLKVGRMGLSYPP
jgi:hypothetical protein